jgi:hypothetical protein
MVPPSLIASESNPSLSQVLSFPRKYKDEAGKTQTPGLKDLPESIQPTFRNMFIRRIMKLVFSSVSPWKNPDLPVYQEEFDQVYPQPRYCLHGDDAVVAPVIVPTLICQMPAF